MATPSNEGAREPISGLVLTADLAALLTADFYRRYSSGQLHNRLPELQARGNSANIVAWKSGAALGNSYYLGISSVYGYNGLFGPQYSFHLRVSSDSLGGSSAKRESQARLLEGIAGEFLDAARSSPVASEILSQRGVDLDSIAPADLFPWFDFSYGKVLRLAAGKHAASKKREGGKRQLGIGDPIVNAVAGTKRTGGVVTAFVRERGSQLDLALSAGHVVTFFGRTNFGTTIQRVGPSGAENIGTYRAPVPFPFEAEATVGCDAATAAVDKVFSVSNRIKAGHRSLTLARALDMTDGELAAGTDVIIMARNHQPVPARVHSVNAANAFVDDEDELHHYAGLIALTGRDGDSKDGVTIRPGDSGALVFREEDLEAEDKIVAGLGLVVGGNLRQSKLPLAYCIRMDAVLDQLELEFVP